MHTADEKSAASMNDRESRTSCCQDDRPAAEERMLDVGEPYGSKSADGRSFKQSASWLSRECLLLCWPSTPRALTWSIRFRFGVDRIQPNLEPMQR
jgi:hypothetical protein